MCVRDKASLSSEWETQMFNKIDGTNVIINQNTTLIIITEISISISFVCFVCTYTRIENTRSQLNPNDWLRRRRERWREIIWNELKIAYADGERERKKQANQVCVFQIMNNGMQKTLNRCSNVWYLFIRFFSGCWKIDMKIWKNELYFVWRTRNKTAAKPQNQME